MCLVHGNLFGSLPHTFSPQSTRRSSPPFLMLPFKAALMLQYSSGPSFGFATLMFELLFHPGLPWVGCTEFQMPVWVRDTSLSPRAFPCPTRHRVSLRQGDQHGGRGPAFPALRVFPALMLSAGMKGWPRLGGDKADAEVARCRSG